MKYKVFGCKKGKEQPFIDHKTKEVFWDGINRDILLLQSDNEFLAKSVFNNLKSALHVKGKWKIWMSEAVF